jgi:hypothetical protein
MRVIGESSIDIPVLRAHVSGWLIAAAALAPTSLARGQSVERLKPIDRVRVTAPSIAINRRPAYVVASRADTLHLRLADRADTVAVPVSAITLLELSRGTHRPWARDGLVGLLTGASLGVLGAALFVQNEQNCQGRGFGCGEEKGWAMGGLGIIGGVVGTVTGVIVGLRPVDRWETVPADAPPGGLGDRSQRHATMAVSLSLRF